MTMNGNETMTSATSVRQGFEGDELAIQRETAAVAVAAAAKAAIEARYILAMKRPRDLDLVRTKLLNECRRPGFAESARYRKPVGSKYNDETGRWEKAFAEGLSIRFAEAAIRHMTNFYSSATSVFDDASTCIIRLTVMDLEANSTMETDIQVAKTVERSSLKDGQSALSQRLNSYGKRVFLVAATDDDVLNKKNALVSKALRTAVLRLIPGDIQDDCDEVCREVLADKDAKDPAAAKKKLFDGFASIGVMPDQLKEYLGHTNDLAPAELANLRGIYTSIRDGETTWAHVTEDAKPAAPSDQQTKVAGKTADLVEKHKGAKGGKPAPKPAAPSEQQTEASPPAAEPAKPAMREMGED